METSAAGAGLAEAARPRSVPFDADAVVDALFRAGLDPASTVVLVGSAARGVRTYCSDVDVLVLNEDGKRVTLKRPGDTHLQQDSRCRFQQRLADGDDYPAWALRFGVPLRDADGWWAEQVAAERATPHWPDWCPKVAHARKRLHLALEMLEIGDIDAAAEELLLAASHVARAVLLRAHTFPLSRPELPGQLQALDADFAALLRQLIFGDAQAEELKSAMAALETRLAQLTVVSNAEA